MRDLDLPALQAFGWNTDDQHQLEAWRNLRTPSDRGEAGLASCLARVIAVERTGNSRTTSQCADGHIPVSGRWFRGDEETRPTIGDWVVIDSQTGMLLDMPRRSVIKRVNPLGALQLIAANVDGPIVTSAMPTLT